MSTPSSAASGQKLSRDDWRKKKELEEARKAGTAPAEVDESGRDINPHIPQYISQAPWYVSLNRPSLTHQRTQEEKVIRHDSIERWYKKGVMGNKKVTKFRKGACQNCGAITHKKKDCLERPRKVGAEFSGKDMRPDEYLQPKLTLTYDGKRDRWNGYNTDQHQEVVEEYAKVEMAKRQLKADRLQTELMDGKLSETSIKEAVHDSDGSDTDEEKYADQADMAGTKFDPKTRTTVRNLRIREDTAKYLYNLDQNSAFYDPKTRSMRENPFKNSKDPTQTKYAGDNFVRTSGVIKDFAQTQMFAWEAYEHGNAIHPLADPTKLEVMHKEFQVNKGDFQSEQKQSILERYGGEEHLDAPPKELLLAQTEAYVEYSRSGNVVRGQERAVAKSRYEEDVFTNNHTGVWGSYWYQGSWGYACCHSLIKGSYCTGHAGRTASQATPTAFEVKAANSEGEVPVGKPQSLMEKHKQKLISSKSHRTTSEGGPSGEGLSGEGVDKLRKALIAEEERDKEMDRLLAMDERKRPYNSLKRGGDSRQPTEEEMEAYRLKRRRHEDPMASYS